MAETLIFSEQTITTTYNSLFQCYLRPVYPPPFSLVIGESYRVMWDGQTFDVTAVDCSSVTGEVAIGNGAAFGLGGNGEPFAVVYTSDVDVTFIALTDTEPTSHTVSVYHVTEEAKIVLKDNNGVNQEYNATKIRLNKSDGTKAIFSEGEAIENVPITLDFSNDAQSQTVTAPPGQLVKSAVIQKPDALIPENIAEGVRIAGVEGSLVAGGSSGGSTESGVSDADKPIRFYDPYGDLLYGYTKEEIQNLEELPPGPELSGLTFEAWTHTLDELKAVTYFADVGPMYKYGSSPANVLILETIRANTTVGVCLGTPSSSTKATIYWGDGSSTSLTGSSNGYTTTTHSYSTIGEHIVAIVSTSGRHNLGEVTNSYVFGVMNNSVNTGTTSDTYLAGTVNFYLKSILLGSYNTYGLYTDISGAPMYSRLKFVSVYNTDTGAWGGSTKLFAHCSALKVVAGKGFISCMTYSLFCAASLRRAKIRTNYDTALIGCDGLEEVEYRSGDIKTPKMNTQWAMLMTTETPPKISATTPVWGTKPIYVPDAAVDTYKAADGWSTVTDYIVPASQYHSK